MSISSKVFKELLRFLLAFLWLVPMLLLADAIAVGMNAVVSVPACLPVAACMSAYVLGRALRLLTRTLPWKIAGAASTVFAGMVLSNFFFNVGSAGFVLVAGLFCAVITAMFFQGVQDFFVSSAWFGTGTAGYVVCSLFITVPAACGCAWFIICMLCMNAKAQSKSNLRAGNMVLTSILLAAVLITANFNILRQWFSGFVRGIAGGVIWLMSSYVSVKETAVEAPLDIMPEMKDLLPESKGTQTWEPPEWTNILPYIMFAAMALAGIHGLVVLVRFLLKKIPQWLSSRGISRAKSKGYTDEVQSLGRLRDVMKIRLPKRKKKVDLNSLSDERTRIRYVYKVLMNRYEGGSHDTPNELLSKAEVQLPNIPEFIDDYNYARYANGESSDSKNARTVYYSLK